MNALNPLFITVVWFLIVVEGDSSCYDDLGALIADIDASRGNERFVVCPNTTLIGFQFGDDIDLSTENTTLQCGETGASSNNCTFEGGADQLIIKTRIFETVGGIQIKGITFSFARDAAVRVLGPATFVDCIFQDNSGTSRFGNPQHVLVEPSRNTPQPVVFRRCAFFNTRSGAHGFLDVFETEILIDQCTFIGADRGFAVRARGARGRGSPESFVSIRNSCFDSNFPGAVQLATSANLVENFNNYGTNNGPCNGLVVSLEGGGTERCEPFTADRCFAVDANPPLADSPELTPEPTPEPTSEPIPGEGNVGTGRNMMRASMRRCMRRRMGRCMRRGMMGI